MRNVFVYEVEIMICYDSSIRLLFEKGFTARRLIEVSSHLKQSKMLVIIKNSSCKEKQKNAHLTSRTTQKRFWRFVNKIK